jgi:hypothetical protein
MCAVYVMKSFQEQSRRQLKFGPNSTNRSFVLDTDGCGFSQMGSGDGTSPGHNALKSQIVGFLFAAAYMRGLSFHLHFDMLDMIRSFPNLVFRMQDSGSI